MAITIYHLDGPLAGQEQEFDNSVEVIVFGRSPECQVVYPPECTEVGRQHFALVRGPAGDYRVSLSGDHYVEVDGVQAKNGAAVRAGSVIRIGRNGPTFMTAIDGVVRFGGRQGRQSDMAEREGWMADIAVEAEEDADDLLEPSPAEREWASAVDLLFRRRSEPPAVTTGIPGDILATRGRPQSTQPSSRPMGVGSGGPQHSQPAESPRLERHSDAPASRPARPEVQADYAPPTQMKMRRGSGLFWWVALALGAAALGYLFFRRETAVGSILAQLLHAAVPPPPAPKAMKGDLVDVSVFGPTAIKAGGEGLIQVFLHHLSQREIAKALARETDPEATRRGVQTLAAEIAEGQRVQIMFDARGLGADQEMQTLVWRGEPCACQFTVTAPEDASGRTFHPRVLVLVDSVPVGSLSFALKVSKEETAGTGLIGDRARRYTYAFLSYASPDRAEVIKRAQGLKAGGTNFFNDLLSLEPGERWEKRLYSEIDRCDVFYLFWSSQAKASEWVMKETEYALARRAASTNGDPDIIPVIIEGPPPPAPPEQLKDIHFNDNLLYVLAGEKNRPPLGRA